MVIFANEEREVEVENVRALGRRARRRRKEDISLWGRFRVGGRRLGLGYLWVVVRDNVRSFGNGMRACDDVVLRGAN